MKTQHSRVDRLHGYAQRVWRVLVIAGVLVGIASPATAGLMNSTYNLRLTGPVSSGGATSVEQYSATNIPFDGSGVSGNGDPVANAISPTPSPSPFTSTSARVDRVFEPTGGTGTTGIATIWILGPANDSTKAFGNPLDPAQLVELELSSLKWDNLPSGQSITVSNFKLDKGLFYDPVSVTYTGTGSVANPLKIVARFNPADVNRATGNGVKVQFSFGTQGIPVPEPASMALAGLACLALASLLGRQPR